MCTYFQTWFRGEIKFLSVKIFIVIKQIWNLYCFIVQSLCFEKFHGSITCPIIFLFFLVWVHLFRMRFRIIRTVCHWTISCFQNMFVQFHYAAETMKSFLYWKQRRELHVKFCTQNGSISPFLNTQIHINHTVCNMHVILVTCQLSYILLKFNMLTKKRKIKIEIYNYSMQVKRSFGSC